MGVGGANVLPPVGPRPGRLAPRLGTCYLDRRGDTALQYDRRAVSLGLTHRPRTDSAEASRADAMVVGGANVLPPVGPRPGRLAPRLGTCYANVGSITAGGNRLFLRFFLRRAGRVQEGISE